jgi:hypothetical protein
MAGIAVAPPIIVAMLELGAGVTHRQAPAQCEKAFTRRAS